MEQRYQGNKMNNRTVKR